MDITTTDHPPEYSSPYIYIILGALNILIGLSCLFFNYIVFTFYFKLRKKFLPIIYCSLSFTDLTMGVAALINAVTLFNIPNHHTILNSEIESGPNPGPPFLLYWLALHFLTTSLSGHVTVYKNVILSVIRTINIKLPFYRVKRTHVIVAVLLYPLIWAFICLYETYHYYHTGGHYGHSKADNTVPDDLPPDVESLIFYLVYLPCTGSAALINLGVPDVIIELLSIGIPFVVPSLICMVCCGIQSQALLKKNEMTCDENLKRQQQITVTIFQVTVVFCVCNTVYFVIALYLVLFHHNKMYLYWILLYVTGTVLPFINSLLNPIILISRSKVLNEFMWTLLGFRKQKERNDRELERDGGLVMMNIMNVGKAALDPLEKKRKISVLNLVEGTTNCILNPVEHHENHLDPVEDAGTTRDGFFEGGITQTNSI